MRAQLEEKWKGMYKERGGEGDKAAQSWLTGTIFLLESNSYTQGRSERLTRRGRLRIKRRAPEQKQRHLI